MTSDKHIIATMKAVRIRKGLTVPEVAERVGYHENTVWRWEGGGVGVPIHAWLYWCEALEITPQQVLDWAASHTLLRRKT